MLTVAIYHRTSSTKEWVHVRGGPTGCEDHELDDAFKFAERLIKTHDVLGAYKVDVLTVLHKCRDCGRQLDEPVETVMDTRIYSIANRLKREGL